MKHNASARIRAWSFILAALYSLGGLNFIAVEARIRKNTESAWTEGNSISSKAIFKSNRRLNEAC